MKPVYIQPFMLTDLEPVNAAVRSSFFRLARLMRCGASEDVIAQAAHAFDAAVIELQVAAVLADSASSDDGADKDDDQQSTNIQEEDLNG